MKFSKLDPRFFTEDGNDGKVVGLTFLCPHCQQTRIGVHFHDAGHTLIGVREPDTLQLPAGTKLWELTGTTFDDISLSPSVDASESGHWHGFVQHGEAA